MAGMSAAPARAALLSGPPVSLAGVSYSNLTLSSHRPISPEKVERYIGTNCGIRNADGQYEPYVIVSAEATDDPHVVSIAVEPGLRF